MTRETMEYLIEFTAGLIRAVPDVREPDQEEIEAALDNGRIELRYQLLNALPVMMGGSMRYLTWETPPDRRWLEEGATVLNGRYQEVTPDSADYRNGRFEFETEPVGAVIVSGYSYDPYGAAYELVYPQAVQQDGKEIQSFTVRNGSYNFIRPPHSAMYRVIRKYLSKSRQGVFMSVF